MRGLTLVIYIKGNPVGCVEDFFLEMIYGDLLKI